MHRVDSIGPTRLFDDSFQSSGPYSGILRQCIAFHVRGTYVTEHRYKDRIIDLLPSQQQNGQWDCPFIVKTFKNHRMDVYQRRLRESL